MEKSFLLEVWITASDENEVREIASDIRDILNDNNITNSINVTEEYSD